MGIIPTHATTYQPPSVVWGIYGLSGGYHAVEISVEDNDTLAPNGCALDRFTYVEFTLPLPTSCLLSLALSDRRYYQHRPGFHGKASHSNKSESRGIGIALGVTAAVVLIVVGGWIALKRRLRSKEGDMTKSAILRAPLLEEWRKRQGPSSEHGRSADDAPPPPTPKDTWKNEGAGGVEI
jgi:hypothetical protein